MATKTPSKTPDVAAKITKYREMAKDKSLPQDVRNGYLDKANELEYSTYKPTMAKGGAVMDKKAMKMNYGGMAMKEPMMDMQQKQKAMVPSTAPSMAMKEPMMAKGGAVVAKAPKSPMKSMSKSPAVVIAVGMAKKPTKMNKGGTAMKQPMMSKGGAVKPMAKKGK